MTKNTKIGNSFSKSNKAERILLFTCKSPSTNKHRPKNSTEIDDMSHQTENTFLNIVLLLLLLWAINKRKRNKKS